MSSIDMERFREDINRYRFETDTTWTALAEKAGVSPAMFTRLKKGSAVTLEAFAQLCASCRLNPIDYMPELQTAQEHETAKEHPMEEMKRLSINGKEFTIRDVDIRSGSAWANGPRISDAELPDGQVLGSIMPRHGEWLWRLAGEGQPAASHRGPVFRHEHRPMGVHDGRRLHHAGHRGTNHAGTSRRPLVSNPLG